MFQLENCTDKHTHTGPIIKMQMGKNMKQIVMLMTLISAWNTLHNNKFSNSALLVWNWKMETKIFSFPFFSSENILAGKTFYYKFGLEYFSYESSALIRRKNIPGNAFGSNGMEFFKFKFNFFCFILPLAQLTSIGEKFPGMDAAEWSILNNKIR